MITCPNCGYKEAPKKAPVLSFAERDEMLKRQKWEEMTGRKWPGRLQLL